MKEAEIIEIFRSRGAIVENGHFIYSSGLHGSSYMNKDAVFPYTDDISKLCKELARKFKDYNVEAVVSPAIGGVILTQWVAHFLSELTKGTIVAVYAEKSEDKKSFVFTRNYDELIKGKKVFIIDDVLTAGTSIKKMIDAIDSVGAQIVGAGVLCNRGGINEVSGMPVTSLFDFKMESWSAKDCPLCKKKIPVNTKLGAGKKLLSK